MHLFLLKVLCSSQKSRTPLGPPRPPMVFGPPCPSLPPSASEELQPRPSAAHLSSTKSHLFLWYSFSSAHTQHRSVVVTKKKVFREFGRVAGELLNGAFISYARKTLPSRLVDEPKDSSRKVFLGGVWFGLGKYSARFKRVWGRTFRLCWANATGADNKSARNRRNRARSPRGVRRSRTALCTCLRSPLAPRYAHRQILVISFRFFICMNTRVTLTLTSETFLNACGTGKRK